MMRRLWVVVALGVIALIAVWASSAHARWREEYAQKPTDVQQWFKSQRNSLGEWCCDRSDGNEYYGDYTVNADGSVTVEGETIPPEKVLRGPNPTGAAVWWKLGTRTYCFAPGTMG